MRVAWLLCWATTALAATITRPVNGAEQNYDILNSLLSGLEIEIDTSTVPPIVQTIRTAGISIEATVTLNERATCRRFGLLGIDIAGEFAGRETIDGKDLEKYLLSLDVDDASFVCSIGLCFKTNFFLDLEEECTGIINVTSTPASRSSLRLRQEVFSEDFARLPPSFTREAPSQCSDKVSLDGITFTASNIGRVAGFDVTSTVQEALNGDSRADAIQPIQDALCDQIQNLTDVLNDLILNNPLANTTNFGVNPDESVDEDALRAERTLLADVPPQVKLIQLPTIFENSLIQTLLPGVGLDDGLSIGFDSPLFEQLFGFLGIQAPTEGRNPLLVLLDYFLGTELAKTDGVFIDLDVLAVAQQAFPDLDVPGLLQFNLSADGVGAIEVGLSSLLLSANPNPERDVSDLRFVFVGNQSIVLPPITLGDLTFKAGVNLKLDVDTTLFAQKISINMEEPFNLNLGWEDFLLKGAVLLAIDGAEIPKFQVGSLLNQLVDCALSAFYRVPLISGALVNADSISLNIGGFEDAILHTFSSLVNAIAPVFQGVIPGTLEMLARDFVIGQEFFERTTCPEVVLNDETRKPYNFAESQIVSFAKGFITKDLVVSTVENFLTRPDGETGFSFLDVAMDLLNITIPQPAGSRNLTLRATLDTVAVDGIFPPALDIVNLLDILPDSKYFPQGFFNKVNIASPSKPLSLSVGLKADIFPAEEVEVPTLQGRLLMQEDEALQVNYIKADFSLESIAAAVELFLAFSVFGIEGTRIQDILDINCWAAKLGTEGGLKDLLLVLSKLGLKVECVTCDNKLLADFVSRLSRPGVIEQPLAFLSGILNDLASNATDGLNAIFEGENWDRFSQTAKDYCEAGAASNASIVDFLIAEATASLADTFNVQFSGLLAGFGFGNETGEFIAPVIEEDLSQAYSFIAIFFSVIGLSGLCTFACTFEARKAKRSLRVSEEDLEDGKNRNKFIGGALAIESAGPAGQSGDGTMSGYDKSTWHTTPLFKHPSVPMWVRFFVPFIIVTNLGMFVVGHVAPVLITDIVGQFADIGFTFDNFAELSVIETTKRLWDGKAYFLAFLLAGFSVVWPYLKIFGVAICWFFPVRWLSFKSRGKFIVLLDQLGKWSLVELYFVAFVFVVLQLDIKSPTNSDLIPEGLYRIILDIQPQVNLYTFTAALLLSLLLGNIVVVFHERVENQILEQERISQGMSGADLAKVSMQEFLFERVGSNGVKYRVSLSWFGALFIVGSVASAIAVLVYASSLTVLRLNISGLVRLLLDLEGKETSTDYNLFLFIQELFTDANAGELFFGTVFVATVLVIPIIQLSMLAIMPLQRFSLRGALSMLEWNQIISAWSATSVFVLAIAVTSIEIKTVSKFIVEENCAALGPIINDILVPFGFATVADVEATCLGITAEVKVGTYIFFIALAISHLVHLFTIKLFQEYLRSRKEPDSPHFELHDKYREEEDLLKLTPGLRVVRVLRLINVERAVDAKSPIQSPGAGVVVPDRFPLDDDNVDF